MSDIARVLAEISSLRADMNVVLEILRRMSRGNKADEMITIKEFVTQIMGLKSRDWFYSHQNDPGFPQRTRIRNKPMLSYRDCMAYVEQLKEQTRPPAPPKRGRGRPRKAEAAK